MPGYKDWIDAIDIKIDYFSAFMKAWIAFNAWYNFSGEVDGKNDRDCIEFICGKINRFRTYIENLLLTDTAEGSTFRENVAALHSALLSAAITTQEYIGVRQTVSFSEVAVKNSNAHEKFEFRNVMYESYRSHGKIVTVLVETRSTTEVFRHEQDEYNLDDLKQQSTFKSLSQGRQEKCIKCYEKLKPYITTSILATGEERERAENHITIGAYSLIKDTGKISQAIITILYMLRCCLAHGDISPDESSNSVYRYAYEVLSAPLKS